jgi:hypothetical protein
MDMVRHQRIGVNIDFVTLSTLFQPMKVGAIVVILKENRLSTVSTLDYVHRHSRKIETGFSRHGSTP